MRAQLGKKRVTIETEGVRRTFEGYVYHDLFRVTRIEGDVTDMDALGQAAQELSILLGYPRVEFKL
jgi:hypothetical protein